METLLLFILLIIVISIIIILAILVYYYCFRNKGGGKNSKCTNQTDCTSGYVCSSGLCTAGLGTICMSNTDCIPGLTCNNTGVCVPPSSNISNISNINKAVELKDASKITDKNNFSNMLSTYKDYFKDNKLAVASLTNDTYIDPKSEYTNDNILDCENIIDVCNYSIYNFYILNDGTINRKNIETKNTEKVESDIKPIQIIQFSGYLYCLSSDCNLYVLDNNTTSSEILKWRLCEWCSIKPTHISSTLDFSYMWFQNETVGYIMDNNNLIINTVPIKSFYRKYGKNLETFVDVYYNDKKVIVQPDNTNYYNCTDAVINFDDTVITIDSSEDFYNKVTILNWEPFFIRK